MIIKSPLQEAVQGTVEAWRNAAWLKMETLRILSYRGEAKAWYILLIMTILAMMVWQAAGDANNNDFDDNDVEDSQVAV